ncbi:MAG: potassium channel family protein [Dactylosporangium sp.]|nr:potassium channel family protein [Dactylosporangium sp.]NNJ62416.1 potassium channel family protein [Dactylosporangium sp.]
MGPHAVRLPRREPGPLRKMISRIGYALSIIVLMVAAVLLDRGGYRDTSDGEVSILDAAYYATVSLTTTGYGDIVPVTEGARLVNIIVIMPLRMFFLALLVGTTFEVLGARTRKQWRLSHWRSKLQDHTVVVGYGTKGRSAIGVLLANGVRHDQVVVIDPSDSAADEATAGGLVAVVGDATRSLVLRQAGLERAARVIVAVDRDDTAVLITLTIRQLNPDVPVSAAVREAENAPLLSQSGATSVITSSDAAGRLLGMSAHSPAASEVIGDLLVHGQGLDLVDRPVHTDEIGCQPGECWEVVLAVVRDAELLRYDKIDRVLKGDRLIVVKPR